MTDTRVRVPLNGKQVDLAQLDQELGGFGLCASETEVVAVEGSPVTEPELMAGIEAHVPLAPTQSRAEIVDALPDPTVDLDGFKAALKDLLA